MHFRDPDTGIIHEIKDAIKPLRVRVTNKNINEATPCDACNCAIAKGAKELKGITYARIGAGVALVGHEGNDHLTRYILKNTDRWSAKKFDLAGVFFAGTYTLTAPKGSRKLGARSGQKPGSNVRTGRAHTVWNSPQVRGIFWAAPEA